MSGRAGKDSAKLRREGISDAEAILSLAEQSARAVETGPGYEPGRDGFAAAALRGFVRAARTLIRERDERRGGTP